MNSKDTARAGSQPAADYGSLELKKREKRSFDSTGAAVMERLDETAIRPDENWFPIAAHGGRALMEMHVVLLP